MAKKPAAADKKPTLSFSTMEKEIVSRPFIVQCDPADFILTGIELYH